MKRYILLTLAVCCLLPASAQQSIREISKAPLCLLAPDSAQKTKQLVILQTSDTHSRIEPIAVNAADRYAGMGGTVRRATFIKEARKVNPDLLLFDCGDISQGTPYYNLFQGEVEVKMMNLMGYDAMTIGNHEFDFGLENMARLFRMANFPVVCANYDVTGTVLEGLVKPYTTFSRNGLKIGVFGLAPKMEGLVQADKCEGVVYNDPIEVAQKFGGAFGGAAVMWILASFGYNTAEGAVQTAEALTGLNLLMSWIPAAVAVVAMIVVYFYPLTKKRVEEINKGLKKVRASD